MDKSVSETAAILGVGRSWLYQKAASGEVAHQRYGRTIRFTDVQVEAIRQQYSQPAISTRRMRRVS